MRTPYFNHLYKSGLAVACLFVAVHLFPTPVHAQLAPTPAPAAVHNTHFLPAEPLFAGWASPGPALQNPDLAKLAKMFEELSEMKESTGITLADVDSVKSALVVADPRQVQAPQGGFSIRFATPAALQSYAATMLKNFQPGEKLGNFPTLQREADTWNPQTQQVEKIQNTFIQTDDRTLVFVMDAKLANTVQALNGAPVDKPEWGAEFAKMANKPLVGVVDLKQVRELVKAQMGDRRPEGMEGMIFNSFATLWEQSDFAVGSVEFYPVPQLNALAICPDEKGAKRVEGTIKGLIALGKSFLPVAKQQMLKLDANNPEKPGEKFFAELEQLVKNVEIKQSANTVNLTVKTSETLMPLAVKFLEPVLKQARAEADRMREMNNVRQIALAMMNYEQAHGHMPPAVVLGPDGKTPHSWRVAILPFLEDGKLYNEYKLDEPWDSENNKKVLAKMPAVFRSVKAKRDSVHSNYYVLTSAGGIFTAEPAKAGSKFTTITDGTSNTLLVVEATREIPWTKPEDISVEKGKVPMLGAKDAKYFISATADGASYSLKTDVDPTVFWNLASKSDGQLVNIDDALTEEEKARRPRPPANFNAPPGAFPGGGPGALPPPGGQPLPPPGAFPGGAPGAVPPPGAQALPPPGGLRGSDAVPPPKRVETQKAPATPR
ncbi:MAG: DUF1559 domain-containing protein [Pirellulales bacterium]|nr:DUF1559 domain-containing protein [Pirellulales bacterium]